MYDPKEMLEQAKEVAKSKKLFFTEEIFSFTDFSQSTFYYHFPKGSEELEEIKRIIGDNKIEVKTYIRRNFALSDDFKKQLVAYKLAASEEELRKLQQHYVDHQNDGGSFNSPIDTSKLSDETLEELKKANDGNSSD